MKFLFFSKDVPLVIVASSVEEAARAAAVFCSDAVFMGIVAQE